MTTIKSVLVLWLWLNIRAAMGDGPVSAAPASSSLARSQSGRLSVTRRNSYGRLTTPVWDLYCRLQAYHEIPPPALNRFHISTVIVFEPTQPPDNPSHIVTFTSDPLLGSKPPRWLHELQLADLAQVAGLLNSSLFFSVC